MPTPENTEQPEPTDLDLPGTAPEEIADVAPTDLVDVSDSELAATDEAIANLYQAIDDLPEGRLNVHSAAQRALFEGHSTVLLSMALARAYQKVARLTEWSGTSSEGANCPVCGFHREASGTAQVGPNRGHAAACPLRKNLDNLNRAIGVTNRGRRQGPGSVLVWDGRLQTSADATAPEMFPSPLNPEGVVNALQAGGATIAPGMLAISEQNLAQLLRIWTIGQATTQRVQALADEDSRIEVARQLHREVPVTTVGEVLGVATEDAAEDLTAGITESIDGDRATHQDFLTNYMAQKSIIWWDLHDTRLTLDQESTATIRRISARVSEREAESVRPRFAEHFREGLTSLRLRGTIYDLDAGSFNMLVAWCNSRTSA